MDLHGFEIIRDMSREDLIEEILKNAQKLLVKTPTNDLKLNVIHIRMQRIHESFVEEADLDDPPPSILGQLFGGN